MKNLVAKFHILKDKAINLVGIAFGSLWILATCMIMVTREQMEHLANDKPSYILTFIITLGIGFLILRAVWKRVRLLKMFNEYEPIIMSDPIHSIDSLAEAIGSPLDEVTLNVVKMHAKGYFPAMRIDMEKRCLRSTTQEQTAETGQITDASPNQETPKISAKCPACGAPNKIPAGENAVCEYCGSCIPAK